MSDTKIYLHGDGAAWIRQGLEWLPNSVFVLDCYHRNKALKHLVSGIDRLSGCQYERLARKAAEQGDQDGLERLRDKLIQRWPERAKSVSEAINYLQDNLTIWMPFPSSKPMPGRAKAALQSPMSAPSCLPGSAAVLWDGAGRHWNGSFP